MRQSNSINRRLAKLARIACLVCAAAVTPLVVQAAATDQKVLEHLVALRAIQATDDDATIDRYNRQMDEAWTFFVANKAAVVPVLRQQLDAETRLPHPSNMMLMDIGLFLMLYGGEVDHERVIAALLAIDASSPIIQQNGKQLFELTHRVAALHDARVLPFLDKAFLRGGVTAFIPQHALRLDEALTCVFVYGVYGAGAEEHLSAQLKDREVFRRTVDTLAWIGSPASVAAVKAAYQAAPEKFSDYESFARMTSFMMGSGGPKGRAAMLEVNPRDLDEQSREYFAKVRPAIEATDYKRLRPQKDSRTGAKSSDAKVRAQLTALKQDGSRGEMPNPLDILDAKIPTGELVSELEAIRSRTLRRLSDEALSEVQMINAIINALHYRDEAAGKGK